MMKKLLINGLLFVGFVAIIVGIILGLSQLRAVDEAGAAVDAYNYQEEYDTAEAIEEQSSVTVTVSDNAETGDDSPDTPDKTTEKTPEESNDDLVNSFLNG
jgi:hypothetical protein